MTGNHNRNLKMNLNRNADPKVTNRWFMALDLAGHFVIFTNTEDESNLYVHYWTVSKAFPLIPYLGSVQYDTQA